MKFSIKFPKIARPVFGRSYAGLIAGLTKQIAALEAYAAAKNKASAALHTKADRTRQEAYEAGNECRKARLTAANLKDLLA